MTPSRGRAGDEGRPLAIDLFCGLGGWTEGLLEEGWRVVGFDLERHVYGDARYPAQLVLQDVRTIDGSQFGSAHLIVASPPCQAYSYRAMPWTRAKALPPPDNTLFEACFRIQREANLSLGRRAGADADHAEGDQGPDDGRGLVSTGPSEACARPRVQRARRSQFARDEERGRVVVRHRAQHDERNRT